MKYRNLEAPFEPAPLSDVLRWALWDRLAGRRRESPPRVVVPRAEPDRALVDGDAPMLLWVGHASWVVRVGAVNLLVDPVWSRALGPGVSRNAEPGIALAALPPIDAVLTTHNHRDHLDAPTIRAIDRIVSTQDPGPAWLCGQGLGGFFRRCHGRVVELPWWGTQVVEGARGRAEVTFVPAQHWSQRGPFDRNASLWGGYVMAGGEGAARRSVYHTGDTAFFSGFAEIGRRFPGLDAALLPIGAYDPEWFMRKQHMDPGDAVRAFTALGARLFCAMHWGTFKLTDEPLDEPPIKLEEERLAAGIPREQVWVPAIGETRAL